MKYFQRKLSNDSLGFFISSLTTHKHPYPLPAAHPAILPTSNPFPFFRRINSAPGKTPTSSSQKSYVVREALGEVVISIFGGVKGSEEEDGEKKDANGSEAISRADSSMGCWADEVETDGSAVRIDGSNSRVLSNVRGTFSARRFYTITRSIRLKFDKAEYATDLLCRGIISL